MAGPRAIGRLTAKFGSGAQQALRSRSVGISVVHASGMNAYTDHGLAAEQEAGDGLAEGRRQSVAGVAVLNGSIILSPFC